MSRNRFEENKTNPLRNVVYLLPLLGFILLFILFYRGVSSVSHTADAKQMESLENAINRSITQCYAVYDETMFYVDYQPIGSNIMPDVTILRRTGGPQ